MPTLVKFSGLDDDGVIVREEVDAVREAIADGGRAVQLTRRDGRAIYLNAERVAFVIQTKEQTK